MTVENNDPVVEAEETMEDGPTLSVVPSQPETVSPPLPTRLSEVDRLVLELAKSHRQVMLADAKTALANNDKSELEFKLIALQLYRKYNLQDADQITEDGSLVRK